ncbi:MAG: LysR family transcriptional regulator [Synergistaceae bacterium]|jgi:DNA-binding transcriptional LysR family regulator|nr:LysR family transcriptional regulator [Synergistaceae bacterium]
MKFEQLSYLQEAVKYKSISLASERNYIAQSSFSSAITKLEQELGVALLHRSSTGVSPTEMGEIVLANAKKIFAARDEILEAAGSRTGGGTVSVSCVACLCDWIIPSVLHRLRTGHIAVSLSVNTAESRVIANNVLSGIVDFGILIYYDELRDNPDLQYVPLFHDSFGLYIGPESPLWNKTSIKMEEIFRQPYIAYKEEFLKDNHGLTSVVNVGKELNIVFRTDELDSMKRMIAQYDYVAFFPFFMTKNDYYLRHDLIRNIPIADYATDFEVGYLISKRFKPSPFGRKILNILRQILEVKAELKILQEFENNDVSADVEEAESFSGIDFAGEMVSV